MPTKNYTYIAFHKPNNVLSQFTSELNQRTLLEFNLPKNIYAAGRLDKDSEGLLILTDDGSFIKKIADPESKTPKTYWVQVERIPDADALAKLKAGPIINSDYKTLPCQAKIIDIPDIEERDPPVRFRINVPTTWLEMTIFEGKNRQVRKMTAAVGHPTLRLIRVKIGKLKLDLNQGEYKTIKPDDIL